MNAHLTIRIPRHSASIAATPATSGPTPAHADERTGAARFARLKALFRHAVRPAATERVQVPPAPSSSEAAVAPGTGRMAEAISQMLADPGWPLAADMIGPALRWVDRVRQGRQPAPAADDDSHARLQAEVQRYLDFRRLRAIEAGLRGCEVGAFAFGIGDWRQAQRAEAGLRADRRRRIGASYLPASSSALFRVR